MVPQPRDGGRGGIGARASVGDDGAALAGRAACDLLSPDYQRILGVLEDRPGRGQGPVRAKDIAVVLGLETSSAKVEGVRAKAKRLAERGWLVQEASGMSSVGRRPVAGPVGGPSA